MLARCSSLVTCAVALLLSARAVALPPVLSISDRDVDATVTLRVLSQTILGDARTWCQVRIVDTGSGDRFTSGDKIYLWVYEDDTVGDELLWSTSFTVSAAEVSANRVDRTFDCSGNFGDDIGAEAEYYAEARVEKDETCGVCFYDRPETGVIVVAEVEDDGAEPDDTSAVARPLGLGTTPNRIARDQDWFSFEVTGPVQLDLEVLHDPSVGRVDLALLDTSNNVLNSGSDRSDRTLVHRDTLEAGVYHVRTSPRVSNDFNHYDIRLTVNPLATDCAPGEEEFQACGNCGQRSRRCNELGRWTAFGSCTGEGVCAAGEQLTESCGFCGTLRTTCSNQCQWVIGTCEGAGVCQPESVETDDCGGERVRTRVCLGTCQWGDYTECGGTQCEAEETEPCYTGPASARGVGACREGERPCVDGLWGSCSGDVLPVTEDCENPLDNDCDGLPDGEDPNCVVAVGDIGDPCLFDAECEGDLECLRSPDFPSFTGGYCGRAACVRDIDCGPDGVCGQVFGQQLCLKRCDTNAQCRQDYVCAGVGTQLGCVPSCERNSDCLDPEFPICDSRSGICNALPAGDPAPEPAPEAAPDAGQDVVDTGGDAPVAPDAAADAAGPEEDGSQAPSTDEACGCGAASGGADANWLLVPVVALGLTVRRRRGTTAGRG